MTDVNTRSTGTFWRTHNYVLTFLVCTLSVTVLLKVGQIQYLELILAADFLLLMGLFAARRFQVRVFRPFLSIGTSYAIFLVLAFLLALIALRQDFFPIDSNPLKQPLVITVSRMAELFLDAFYALFLASAYREDEKLCIFGAKVYYWTGIASGIYALATFPLNLFFEIDLGTSGALHRLRGFDNEGGPYGIYLITVCALTVAMYHKGWISRRRMIWSMALLLICMAGSQSKAAFFAIATIGIFYLMLSLKGWKLWALLSTAFAGFILLALVLNIPAQVAVYEQASAMYQEASNLRPRDANMVMGRVAGAFLAPRMIAAHPFLGIGWGNYPLVRDDPQYRRGTAFALSDVDSPSLGPIDYIVELGFPLWIYLTWLFFQPAYSLRRNGADPWVLCLAAMQPVSNWFGTHLNIGYPWAVLGLALGIGFGKKLRARSDSVG